MRVVIECDKQDKDKGEDSSKSYEAKRCLSARILKTTTKGHGQRRRWRRHEYLIPQTQMMKVMLLKYWRESPIYGQKLRKSLAGTLSKLTSLERSRQGKALMEIQG
ncbi:hypothetical protein I3842_09G172500 [Carya illinoinensis]|uniref:Uncharacterized protein n=1 Tax=Carya illinoinensis TaxID=32201 RepID=A0A922E805_CARIL|nr:hypothetical protein I3842_09G172500 [Carya illinoinensis]